MAQELEVTIGSVELNQNLSPGNNFFVLHNTAELLSTLSVRKTDVERQGGHGTEDSLSFYEARILPFDGELHASSQSARITLEKSLRSAVSLPVAQNFADDDGYVLVLFTDEDAIGKQIYAKILEPPTFSLIQRAMPESRRFSFVMYAKDPTIYAQDLTEEEGPESFNTTTFTIQDDDLPEFKDGALPTFQDDIESELTVTNDGTYGTPPTIVLTGPTTNPVITNTTTGKAMTFNRNGGLTLADDTETLTIDVNARTIVKNDGVSDTDESGKLSLDSEWIYIEPGANVFTVFDDTPAVLESQMTISFRSAWI